MNFESPLTGINSVQARKDHPVWQEIAPRDGKGGFRPEEFKNPYQMDVEFLRLLYRIRQDAGVPMRPISDARDPDGDVGVDKSAHKKRWCRAVDLRVKNRYERACVTAAAILNGIRRWGTYPGDAKDGGSLHIDAETHPDNPSMRNWTKY